MFHFNFQNIPIKYFDLSEISKIKWIKTGSLYKS